MTRYFFLALALYTFAVAGGAVALLLGNLIVHGDVEPAKCSGPTTVGDTIFLLTWFASATITGWRAADGFLSAPAPTTPPDPARAVPDDLGGGK